FMLFYFIFCISFYNEAKRTDKEGFTRDFKEYRVEKLDSNAEVIPEALTLKGYIKKITANPS
ncbi:MAG: hypothetical protein Q4A67_07020, partial [Aerococcus sp.]|nr:hypothetical protein [Aerococcus sp.]